MNRGKNDNLKGGGRRNTLTPKQRTFVSELMVDENGTRAARMAGYKHPDIVACFLQDERKYPVVAAAIREARARKELAAELKADDVLRYIHCVMTFCPADYFEPGGNGGWVISDEGYRELPREIRMLIEEMEVRTVQVKSKGKTVTSKQLWVRFVSKARAMTLAAKHQLGDRVHLATSQRVEVNWHELYEMQADRAKSLADQDANDPIEQQIRALEQQRPALPCPRPNGLKELNGNCHD